MTEDTLNGDNELFPESGQKEKPPESPESYYSEVEMDVVTIEAPRWMVKHMLGSARHSKHTSATDEGKKDAEKIEKLLEYSLKRDTDD